MIVTDQAILNKQSVILMRSEGRQASKCELVSNGAQVTLSKDAPANNKQSRWAMNIEGNVNALPAHASL